MGLYLLIENGDIYTGLENVRAFVDSRELKVQMGNKIIEREDVLEQYAPWLPEIDECGSDNYSGDMRVTLPHSPLCKVVIMQCETLKSGRDNQERENLKKIMNDPNNKHVDKD